MKQPPERERLWLNLLLNVGIPVVVLIWLDAYLGPLVTLLVALASPLIYGMYQYLVIGRKDIFSVISIFGLLLNAGVGLLRLGPEWVIWKEPVVPLVLGVFSLISLRTGFPVWRVLYHESVYSTEAIDAALSARGNEQEFQRTLRHVTFVIAGAFFLAALLNYWLARALIKSQPGTAAFNAEFARMTALSWTVEIVPVLLVVIGAALYLAYRLWQLTGLPLAMLYRSTSKRIKG